MSFVHLHCHSEYSLLDGANRIDDLIARAVEFEQPALAITDHGNLHAAWEFQEKARAQGIKPIIGMEAYVATGDRRTRSRATPGDRSYYHLVLLARDRVGYQNLIKLSSLAYTEGFYGKPRVDRELLEKYNEGIIVSSACMAGEVARHLLEDRFDDAQETAEWYADVFKDRYYLEVQAHEAGEQKKLNAEVFRLAKKLNLPVIATNDSHFLRAEDHDAHDVLLCIGLKKDRLDDNRMKYDRGLYFKSAPEIREHFRDRPDVLANTLAIADQAGFAFEKKYYLPSFPLPKGTASESELLVELATAGAFERYAPGATKLPDHVRERLDFELGVITSTGYAGYLLIVADFIRAAREKGIPVGPGRGSSAASLVAYSLRITDVCPLKFDLLFERFLNPERVSMPDIDVDFCEERRGEVIEYVRQKYGRDCVGQIITFGTLKSRAAIKDIGRVLGFTPAETDAIAKLIPNQPNFSLTVKEATERVPEVRKLSEGDDGTATARFRNLARRPFAARGNPCRRHRHRAGSHRRIRPCVHPGLEGRRRRRRRARGRDAVRHDRPREGRDAQDGLPRAHDAHDHPPYARDDRGARPPSSRPRDSPARRRGHVSHPARRPHRWRVPVRVAARNRHRPLDARRPFRRPRGVHRADAPRPARRRDAPRLLPPQARRGAGDLRAP
jgi:DNA polymerase-3 subunit alpha